tara:strand:+ start:736 stop:1338 length:603 start_codon:yes stop_codon:yes gene_type:complete
MTAQAYWAGFGLGLSLILAIGAQNAFVLRQGILRQHVLAVVLACALSDALLIAAGVAGFGRLVTALPWLSEVMRLGGAAFLLVYGALALRNALRGGDALEAASGPAPSLLQTLAICLTLTWANPHVYLDTVVLLGAVAADYDDRTSFAIGAMTASIVFFTTLGFGARLLAPVFRKAMAWRVLNASVALVMWSIAASLLLG